MLLKEFSTKVSTKKLNENLAKQFGTKIDVSKFTTEQLEDARNKIRTKLSQIETNESFEAVHSSDDYHKNKLFLDILNTAIAEREENDKEKDKDEKMVVTKADKQSNTKAYQNYKKGDKRYKAADDLNEGAEEQSALVMASKDMVDRVTGWMEDTAEMQTESMLELADAIRDEMGSEASEAFTSLVKPALESMYGVMETTRGTLTQGVGQLTGESDPMDTMGAEDPADSDMEPTVDADDELEPGEVGMPDEDDFGASDADAGGENPGGREKRESKEHSKKKLK